MGPRPFHVTGDSQFLRPALPGAQLTSTHFPKYEKQGMVAAFHILSLATGFILFHKSFASQVDADFVPPLTTLGFFIIKPHFHGSFLLFLVGHCNNKKLVSSFFFNALRSYLFHPLLSFSSFGPLRVYPPLLFFENRLIRRRNLLHISKRGSKCTL